MARRRTTRWMESGNDYLSGGSGSDTYIFGLGYGQDIVDDDDETSHFFGDPYTDTLQFKDSLWSDLTFIRVGGQPGI